MTLSKGAVLTTLLVATLAGGYYWATEPVRFLAPGAASPEVRRNPFLAAQTLLQRWHQPTRQISSTGALFPLPGLNTVIVMDGTRGRLGADRVRQLLAWVYAGGHLILGTPPLTAKSKQTPTTQTDPLLAALGIQAIAVNVDIDAPDATLAKLRRLLGDFEPVGELLESISCRAPLLPEPASMSVKGQPRTLQSLASVVLDYSPLPGKDQTVLAKATNKHGNTLIQLRDGKGQVTVIADLTLWDNQHLHYFDHAWLLRHLAHTVSPGASASPVWFVRGISMPPLPLWLWEHAWPLMLTLALALAAWLWRRLPRCGPIWEPHANNHTDYLGHLNALGHFHWRLGRSHDLLAPLRTQVRRRLTLLHPDLDQAITLAAEQLNENQDEVETALTDTMKADDPQRLTRQVALLRRLMLIQP